MAHRRKRSCTAMRRASSGFPRCERSRRAESREIAHDRMSVADGGLHGFGIEDVADGDRRTRGLRYRPIPHEHFDAVAFREGCRTNAEPERPVAPNTRKVT